MTEPQTGRTPSAPDVDQPEGGAHTGETELDASGRTPDSPGVDETRDASGRPGENAAPGD